MTLDEIQNQVSLDIDSSSSALDSTNQEYARRTKIINRFERLWAERKSYVWNVLLKETTLTITADTTSVALPSDFTGKNISLSQDGMIKIGERWYQFKRHDEAETYESSALVAYLLGNDASGYTLNVKFTDDDDRTVYLNYYSNSLATNSAGDTEKTVLTTTTDVTKCPNPLYLAYSTLAALYKADDEIDKGLDYERLAENEMDSMISNENSGNYQQITDVEDLGTIMGYESLGDWDE